MTAKEVFDKVKRYRSYFGTEGGVTVSGGEPLMQCEFLSELFELCHQEGIHTAIDTSGHGADLQSASAALEKTDLVLLDLKMTTEEAYRKNTKGSLHQTLRRMCSCRVSKANKAHKAFKESRENKDRKARREIKETRVIQEHIRRLQQT